MCFMAVPTLLIPLFLQARSPSLNISLNATFHSIQTSAQVLQQQVDGTWAASQSFRRRRPPLRAEERTTATTTTTIVGHLAGHFLPLVGAPSSSPAEKLQPSATSVRFQPSDKFILIDRRLEHTSMNRYCIAYAIILARLTHRIFVAPSIRNGYVVNPAVSAVDRESNESFVVKDAMDFWDIRSAAPDARMVHMRDFLARYPIELERDHWRPGEPDFTIAEEWVLPAQKEMAIAPRISNLKATVLILRENGTQNMCWMFKEAASMHPWRQRLYESLDKPAEAVKNYAKDLIAHEGGNFLVVQWRSMTNPLMYTLRGQAHVEAFDAKEQAQHHKNCAKAVAGGAKHILHGARNKHGQGSLKRVVLFSDVHTGEGGYMEFDKYWKQQPHMEEDRAEAVAYLTARNFSNGDDVVAQYMLEHPLHAGYEKDQGLMGILIEQVCVHAPALMTCTRPQCKHCARTISGFSLSIVRARTAEDDTKCLTWVDWYTGERPPGCH